VVSPDSAALWGPYLGTWASFNLSGDSPEVAALAVAGVAAKGTPVDGVVALDAHVVQALLAGTGKVEHRGVTSDGSNAAAFFTKDLYAQYRTSTASMRRTNWRAVRDGRSVDNTGTCLRSESGKCRGAPVVPPNDDTLGRQGFHSQIWAGTSVGGAEASTRTPVCRLRPAGQG
jgi:hypothetical protein